MMKRTLCLALAMCSLGVLKAMAEPEYGAGANYPYEDEWFSSPSEKYNHGLAKCSVGMAVAAFRLSDQAGSDNDADIRKFLSERGFDEFSSEGYDQKPTENSIATCLASKRMEGYTLVAAAVAGGNYGDEWLGNFNIGAGDEHEGFAIAADQAYERVKSYLADHNIDGRVKIWTTGYSRAAAVANLLAARLLADEAFDDNDVFAYTFATPRTTLAPVSYPQIFNILSPADPVPLVPMGDWGYARNGVDLFLPSREASADYSALLTRMLPAFAAVSAGAQYENGPESRFLLHRMIGLLENEIIVTREKYLTEYLPVLRDAWKSDEYTSLGERLSGAIKRMTEQSASPVSLSLPGGKKLSELSEDALGALLTLGGFRGQGWPSVGALARQIGYQHYPNVYIAWLFAFENGDDVLSLSSNSLRLTLTGDCRVELRDASGTPLAACSSMEDAPAFGPYSAIRVGGRFILEIPAENAYSLRIVARKTGSVQCRLVSFSAGQMNGAALWSEDILVAEGDAYVCALPDGKMEKE